MAHVMKHTKASTGHMTHHYDRTANNISNDKIDPTRTELNYNLGPEREMSQVEFINQRCSEVQCLNRKDVNVMCSWTITSPQGIHELEDKEFFEESYKFLSNRYGEKNVISAYVHADETTPHMHFAFVPVVEDKKKGIEKVSAKECITKKDLQTFHQDLDKHMEKFFRRDIKILNQATKDGNKSIQELKRETATDKINNAEAQANEIINSAQKIAKENLDKMNQDIKKTAQEVEKFKNDINVLENQKQGLERELEGLQGELKGRALTISGINKIIPEKTITGAIKGVTIENIENLKTTAIIGLNNRFKYEQLNEEHERIKQKIPSTRELLQIAKDKKRLEQLEKAFTRLPENIKEQLIENKNQVKTKDLGHER